MVELQEIAQAQALGGVRKRRARDKVRAAHGEQAFRVVGEGCIDGIGGKESEYGVAEELQTLVVAILGVVHAAGGRGERPREEGGIAEGVADLAFEFRHLIALPFQPSLRERTS